MIDRETTQAVEVQKYASAHVKPNWTKLFMDGTVETGTGFVDPLYPDGHRGIPNWSEDEITDITRKANANGLTMHIHAMGNMAVNCAVNAYVNVSSHSDFLALSGSPDDPFGIMEIAVTGVNSLESGKPWWTEELITREQALKALTINVAKQMFLEDERGSIKTGKFADFLLVTKDVLTCPETEIHTAKPAATYFEGKKVFSA